MRRSLGSKSEAHVDAAFNYKTVGDLGAEVRKHCLDGIDVYFESVGDPHLEAALDHMNPHGRIVLCGMIAIYNAIDPPPGPRNLFLVTTKRLTVRGFIISDHLHRMQQFRADMAAWIKDGRITWKETIAESIENAPQAFIGLFKGENFGKMLVKIGPDPWA